MSTPTEILLSVIGVAALFYAISVAFHSIRDHFVANRDLLRSLEEKLEKVERDLKRVREIAEDSEVPENERRHRTRTRAFEGARELSLPFLRNLPAGTTMQLISRPRDHPSETGAVDEFDYRHERVEEGETTKYGKRVQGFSRHSASEEWSPYTFFANDAQASASSGSEHLRRRLK
jgi:hypothetical protein